MEHEHCDYYDNEEAWGGRKLSPQEVQALSKTVEKKPLLGSDTQWHTAGFDRFGLNDIGKEELPPVAPTKP